MATTMNSAPGTTQSIQGMRFKPSTLWAIGAVVVLALMAFFMLRSPRVDTATGTQTDTQMATGNTSTAPAAMNSTTQSTTGTTAAQVNGAAAARGTTDGTLTDHTTTGSAATNGATGTVNGSDATSPHGQPGTGGDNQTGADTSRR